MGIIAYSNKLKCPCCHKVIIVKAVPRLNNNSDEFKALMEWAYSETEFIIIKGNKAYNIYK